MRILEAISSSGSRLGCDRLGLSVCWYGKDLKEVEIESDALLALSSESAYERFDIFYLS